MRRGLMRFLPVFVLALTVQILAPIGACLATAIAASDPLAKAVFCQGAVADQSSDQQSGHHVRKGTCAVCAAVTPYTPPAPQPVIAKAAPQDFRVIWLAFTPHARVAKLNASPQARAPPFLS